jgi:hypothetical protein
MLTIGFHSIVPGKEKGQHGLSFPAELGFAYPGAAKIGVTLHGTACTNEGCFTFADNAEAQDSLKAEIQKLNNRLESSPSIRSPPRALHIASSGLRPAILQAAS